MAKDDPTKVSGAFLAIEKDQSMFDPKDAKDGKADPNPYLESHKVKGDKGEFTSHTVWYSKSQMDMMMAAGQTAKQADGRNAIVIKQRAVAIIFLNSFVMFFSPSGFVFTCTL